MRRWRRFPAIWVHFDHETEPPRMGSWRAWRRIFRTGVP
jgi:hypothetical protein